MRSSDIVDRAYALRCPPIKKIKDRAGVIAVIYPTMLSVEQLDESRPGILTRLSDKLWQAGFLEANSVVFRWLLGAFH